MMEFMISTNGFLLNRFRAAKLAPRGLTGPRRRDFRMMTRSLPATEQEIEGALQQNLRTLGEAFLDLLAALILVVIVAVSLTHALLRIVFAVLGLLLWTGALIITALYWLRAWSVSRSSSSLHKGRN
jgi:4-hydroxybenzoate polyprenyltransferase